MKKLAFALALALSSIGYATEPDWNAIFHGNSPTASTPTRPLTKIEKETIQSLMGKVLIDEVSARWEWPPLIENPICFGIDCVYIYCGFVNSKNRMGAYTGYTSFVMMVHPQAIGLVRVDLPEMCNHYGYFR